MISVQITLVYVETDMNDAKVPNEVLLAAGLDLMRQAGKPLEKMPAKGRAMIYRTSDGETVRIRTCNDHVLVALAASPNEGARLNIEGTDHLLIVMPETPRQHGAVIAYFIPSEVAVRAVRSSHAAWLASRPNTDGDNKTWCVWFDDDGPAKANGFAQQWLQYRLSGKGSTQLASVGPAHAGSNGTRSLGEVIATARKQIAEVAGVSFEAVKITVDLTA
jgi:hypothetical protein